MLPGARAIPVATARIGSDEELASLGVAALPPSRSTTVVARSQQTRACRGHVRRSPTPRCAPCHRDPMASLCRPSPWENHAPGMARNSPSVAIPDHRWCRQRPLADNVAAKPSASVSMCLNCTAQSECDVPSRLLRTDCKLSPSSCSQRLTVVELTFQPAFDNAAVSCARLLHVHRNGHSGSPRVNGATSFSSARLMPAATARCWAARRPGGVSECVQHCQIPALDAPPGWSGATTRSRPISAHLPHTRWHATPPPPIAAARARRETLRPPRTSQQSSLRVQDCVSSNNENTKS